MTEFKEISEKFERALLTVDRLAAKNIIMQSRSDLPTIHLIEKVIVPALERIGSGWQDGDVALSQVYMSGRICEELVETILSPSSLARKNQPKMTIAVLKDYHMMGKRIVYSVLRAGGFELLDYGRVTVDELITRVQEDNVKIILISVLMLPSALRVVKEVRARLNQASMDVKIIVGGAPFRFDDKLWQEVGADAMGKNASEAIKIVSQIMEALT
jgi:methanogenic corrinoid protein MtbC1